MPLVSGGAAAAAEWNETGVGAGAGRLSSSPQRSGTFKARKQWPTGRIVSVLLFALGSAASALIWSSLSSGDSSGFSPAGSGAENGVRGEARGSDVGQYGSHAGGLIGPAVAQQPRGNDVEESDESLAVEALLDQENDAGDIRSSAAVHVGGNTPNGLLRAFDAYDKLHADILAGRVPKRVLVFETNVEFGMGNKLTVLMSALMLAIVSERALLVNWPASHGDKITHRSDLHPAERAARLTNLGISDMLEAPGIEWDAALWLKDIALGRPRPYKTTEEELACANISEKMGTAEYVAVSGWDNFMPALALNPVVQSLLGDTLATGENIRLNLMHHVALRYFRPLPKIRAKVDRAFSKLRPASTGGLLGLHIRAHTAQTGPLVERGDYMRRVAECAYASGLSHWLVVTDDESMRASLQRAAAAMQSSEYTLPDIVWYESGELSRETENGIITAFVELQLLARCDAVMHLAGTTFGRLAGALRGRPTRILSHEGECIVRPFSEPCYYGWRGPRNPPCLANEPPLPEAAFHSHATCWSKQ